MNKLTLVTSISVICGLIIGIILKYSINHQWIDRKLMYYQFIGELFLRAINFLILPLIVSSVISASCNLTKSGSIGFKALLYYITTTTFGIILCVTLVLIIKPGYNATSHHLTVKKFITTDTFLDLLRNLFADNLIKITISQYQTVLIEPENKTEDIYKWEISHEYKDGTNVLGLVGVSLLFGTAIGHLDEKGKPLLDFFQSLSAATMHLINWILTIIPVGIIFLISGKILETEDISVLFSQVGIYVSTVLLGLFIHSLIVLPVLCFICTKKFPYKRMCKCNVAFITAIGTSSSSATVPTTIKCLDGIGINSKVSRFIAPIGATISMDGIALYETIGALFIVQQRGLNYSSADLFALAITCTVSCIGAAGLPSGGYVMLILVLQSIGIPAEDVTIIITIDCFVDRIRTIVNVISDIIGAMIIDHFTPKDSQYQTLLIK